MKWLSAKPKNIKKIGYLTALIITIGSTMGMGVFFKTSSVFQNVGGSTSMALASWMIGIVGIFALGLALIETSSANFNKGGILEWVKRFTPKRFYEYSAWYLLLIYFPLMYFALPIFATMALQNVLINAGISDSMFRSGWVVIAIAFAFFTWMTVMGFFNRKASLTTQWIFTVLKFIPILVIPVISIMNIIDAGEITKTVAVSTKAESLTSLSPWLGIIASVPSVLFAVNGFYSISNFHEGIKKEKSFGVVIAISLSIVSALYAFLAITQVLGSYGSYSESLVWIDKNINDAKAAQIFKIAIDASMIIVTLGVLNGFALSTYKTYEQSSARQAFSLVLFVQRIFKVRDTAKASWLTSYLVSTMFYLILFPLAFFGSALAADYGASLYGETPAMLYMTAQVITNVTTMITLFIIATAILGTIINRKRISTYVYKRKYFLIPAIFSTALIYIGAAYMVVNSLVSITGQIDAVTVWDSMQFFIIVITVLIPISFVFIKYTYNTKWWKSASRMASRANSNRFDDSSHEKISI